MSQLKIKGTRILDEMLATDKRFILNIGGSRSSKTFSIMQFILIYCLKNKDKTITIARKTFPSLRLGAYREFMNMLKVYDIYKTENHNKTNNFYLLNGNTIQFISIDQSQKLRGLQHDLVFIDECNEISKEEADQIFMRTNGQIILAENPSNALHWSLQLKEKENCLYIHSTYLDNPFIPSEIVKQIESYKDTDEDMWRVFGLGLPSKNNELVYNDWKIWYNEDELYSVDSDGVRHPLFEEVIWGYDFGYNHPSALVKIWIDSNYKRIWCKEIIHESYLTTDDLITKMNQLGVSKEDRMWGDSAEPKTIESIRRAGYDIKNSNKEVKTGIDCVKSYKLFIHNDSTKLQNELRRYKWKMNGEIKTDEPIRLFDDGLCAIRYAVWTWHEKFQKINEYDFDVEWI